MLPGSAWVRVPDSAKPQVGSEIMSETLAAAISAAVDANGGSAQKELCIGFSRAELASFEVPELKFDSFIRVKDAYFQQRTSAWGDGAFFEQPLELRLQGMAAAAGERVHVQYGSGSIAGSYSQTSSCGRFFVVCFSPKSISRRHLSAGLRFFLSASSSSSQ